MKQNLFFLLIFFQIGIFSSVFAQDTINQFKRFDGSRYFMVVKHFDTTLVTMYPEGMRESWREMKNNLPNGKYLRWYENGSLMWDKTILNGLQEGKAHFYNNRGKEIATLNFHQDTIKDTLFIVPGICVILGKIMQETTTRGGAMHEDGRSNTSTNRGPLQGCAMYAALIDSSQIPEKVIDFRTDMNGDFFIFLKSGKIGFFLSTTVPTEVAAGQCIESDIRTSHGTSKWIMNCPLIIKKQKLVTTLIRKTVLEYAP